MQNKLATIENAVAHLQQGKMIILVDDADRENEGDLVVAGEYASAEIINFMAAKARGLICLAMDEVMIERLQLPMMTQQNKSTFHTGFTVSIEAAQGVTTGISAADRARTIKTAIADQAKPSDVVMPGHIFPLKAKPHGVLERNGHTEGSVDLMKLAGLKPAAVICEIMREDGAMARMPDLQTFAKQHDLPIVSIADLKDYRLNNEVVIEQVAKAHLPIDGLSDFTIKVFRDVVSGEEHVVLQKGDITKLDEPLVRIHSQCLTGDVFGSTRCDCGWQLQAALQQIDLHGGLLVYLAQEGRGIGIANKIKAYALQDKGMDTVEANRCLGFADDLRDYVTAAQILRSMSLKTIRLLTNNPRKINDLSRYGLVVKRHALEMSPRPENVNYLLTKRNKLGHLLELLG